MSYTIKTRGRGGFVAVEYLCPEHGRFDETVERDENGDPPATHPCPGPLVYADDELGAAEQVLDEKDAKHATGLYCPTEDEIEPHRRKACGRLAEHVISAPKPKVLSVPCTAEVRGGDMKERPPGMLDTRPLAEGQSYTEWKKDQAKLSESRRHDELVKKGFVQKRIQVG